MRGSCESFEKFAGTAKNTRAAKCDKKSRQPVEISERGPLDTAGHLSDIIRMVSFVTVRDLSKTPGRVLKNCRKNGPQVVTQNGRPAAYMLPASRMGIEADIETIRLVRLGQAIDAMRVEAAKTGSASMSEKDIEAEIQAARRERRQKK